jgi:hypothetical protein
LFALYITQSLIQMSIWSFTLHVAYNLVNGNHPVNTVMTPTMQSAI